jgi:hypothetical protein
VTSIDTTRCDQCGKTALRQDREGWLHISLTGPAHHRALVDAILSGTGHGGTVVDLCSWACARDYATVQLLDPEVSTP